jgi:GDP-L-fucose synthase
MNKTILITGSTGMVGRNAAESLNEADYNVLAPTRMELDLTQQDDVKKYFESHKIDVVLHAAGLVGGIQANIERPYSFLYQNAQIAINVINSAIDQRVKHFINLGSSCMYPKNSKGELTEDMILTGSLEPTNEGYAIAKIMSHKLCNYAKSEFGLNYKTLIPCNLYGKYDNFHPVKSHLLPAAIRKIHNATKFNNPVEIWGSGKARREFMLVDDLVDFILWSINHYDELPDLINVGVGKDYSINEYYQIIGDIIGFEGEFIHDLTKPEGMSRKLCSVQKQIELGWKPRYTLKQGIEKTYQFYLDNHAI